MVTKHLVRGFSWRPPDRIGGLRPPRRTRRHPFPLFGRHPDRAQHERGDCCPHPVQYRGPPPRIGEGQPPHADVLVGYHPNLHLLRDLHATAVAAGGPERVSEIVAALPSTFLIRDTTGVLWDTTTQQPLSRAAVRTITQRYDEIIAANASEAFVATMHGYWVQLEDDAARQQAVHGYALDDLLTTAGSLDLARVADLAARADSAEVQPSAFTDHGRQCFLFVCWHRFTGHIATANQATQGGFLQERDHYNLATPPSRFNSIVCVTNGPVTGTAYLGCGPSAFIGLVGERFKNHGTTFSGMNRNNTTLLAFRQWMVAPVGINGRPRIANNMGTCAIGSNHEGLTTLAGFTSGAQTFLNYTNSGLTLRYNAGMGGTTGWNSGTAATMIHLQVGVHENPVVATYWLGIAAAHYAAIKEYDIMWGAGVTINIKTIDHPTTWHGLAGNWHYQVGVFYLE